nr:MAG TPA: hypothetical protein [Caudoviricetes sp.]
MPLARSRNNSWTTRTGKLLARAHAAAVRPCACSHSRASARVRSFFFFIDNLLCW